MTTILTNNKRHRPSRWIARRDRLHALLERTTSGDKVGHVVDLVIATLILLNVLAVMLDTVHGLANAFRRSLWVFEVGSVSVFTIEYLLRIWSCTADHQFAHPVLGRLRYLCTQAALIDLLAILPFYLPLAIPFDLRVLRLVRLLRMTRLLKLTRYSEAHQTIRRVLQSKKEELGVTIFLIMVLLVIASTLMYYVEYPAQPKVFSSIPAAMWWAVVTVTTVGYGDVYPITTVGKILGAMIALLGVGLFALPAGILGSGFVEEMQRKKSATVVCPHCKRNISL